MTNPDELLRLAERVEQGSGYDQKLRNDLIAALDQTNHMGPILVSIDAVEALRERLLPGSVITVKAVTDYVTCRVSYAGRWSSIPARGAEGAAPTEARARLAALLRAVAEKEATR